MCTVLPHNVSLNLSINLSMFACIFSILFSPPLVEILDNMGKHAEMESQLVDAIRHGQSDVALYTTCLFVHQELHTELENVFIQLCAQIGEQSTIPFVATWSHVCVELLKLVESDEMHISDVLRMTTMISLLHNRLAIQNTDERNKKFKRHQVKKEIMEYFPEKARLSYRGVEVFDRIVPKAPEDLNAFVHRVLAGFTRLLEQKMVHEVYQSLVYISKKRIQLPLPTTWPAPDEEHAKQGDPIWLLWGMVLLYFRSAEVATNWKLFCQNFKKKHKVQRAGLLYGLSFHLDVATNQLIWTPQEERVLQKINDIAPTLWADFLEHNAPQDDEQPEESLMDYFEPRRTHTNTSITATYACATPTIAPVKSIEVLGNSRSQGKSDLRPKLTKIKKIE